MKQEKVEKYLVQGYSENKQREYYKKLQDYLAEECSQVNEVVKNDIYADDCLSGVQPLQRSDKLQ